MINTVAWCLAALWLLLLARLLNSGTRYDPVHIVRFIAWGWAIMFFANATQLIGFPAISWEPWLYLVTFPSVQMIGAAVIGRRVIKSRRKDNDEQAQNTRVHQQVQALTQIVVILGFFAVLVNLYIQFSVRGFDPAAADLIRSIEYQAQAISALGWIGQITLITTPLTWTALILALVFAEQLRVWHRWLGVLVAFGIVLLGVANAGRTDHMKLGLVIFAAIMVRRSLGLRAWPWKWNIPIRILAILLAGIMAWYFGYVWVWRSGGVDYFYQTVWRFHVDAQESQALLLLLQAVPDNYGSIIISFVWYISTLMDNFASFYTRVQVAPMWGLWQTGLNSVLGRLGLPVMDSLTQLLYVEAVSAEAGLHLGQFRTMAQDFILDFGKGGALIASVVYGAGLGFFYRKFRNSSPRVHYWAPMYVLMISWALYSAWNSPINLPQLILGAYLVIYGIACNLVSAGRFDGVLEVKADVTRNRQGQSIGS